MLRVRQEQGEVFRQQMLDRFETNAVRHLRTHLAGPVEPYTDDELRIRIRASIPRAEEYGLISEQHLICFIDTTYLLGDEFDTDPEHAWTVTVLRSEKLELGQKASVLLATATNVYNRRIETGADR